MTSGPERLSLGDSFGMKMRMGVPYRMRSKVVEFEPDRRIAWCHFGGPSLAVGDRAGGRGEVAGHRDVRHVDGALPAGPAAMGYPKGHAKNVAASVGNVVAHFQERPGPGRGRER